MTAPRPTDVEATPEILQLDREIARSGIPVLLRDDEEELAVLMPAFIAQPHTTAPGLDGDEQDTLLNIIGIGESNEPTDIAKHEAEYLPGQ